MKLTIYRYNPETDREPYVQDFELDDSQINRDMMLLDALLLLKTQDETLGFRRSCGEGVCGSDGMNVNGRNLLACITPLFSLRTPIDIRPMPGLPERSTSPTTAPSPSRRPTKSTICSLPASSPAERSLRIVM